MNQVRWIAEMSSNHQRDLARCLQFVDTAAYLGCWAIKGQLFRIRELFAPEALRVHPELLAREAWELPVAYLKPIAEACWNKGIQCMCTPFYLEAVEQLFPYIDIFKIASYSLLHDSLLVAVAQTGLPVVLSTGMATLPEVEHAIETLYDAGCTDLTLLHCISSYPALPADCNLQAIATMQERFSLPVGLSDHSVNPNVLYRAIYHWDASMVEFHLDLDATGEEYAGGHCWLPEQIRPIIQAVRDSAVLDGDGIKAPQASETIERQWRADPLDGLRPLMETRATLR